jgi:hypothetical protein
MVGIRAMKHAMRVPITALSTFILVVFAVGVGTPRNAHAVGGDEAAMEITGYWGGSQDTDKQVIGTLKLVNDKGKDPRTFAVTYARTYDPPTIGMDVFQPAAILPAHVVYGREKLVTALFGAPDRKTIRIIGVYRPDNGELDLGSVKLVDDSKAAPNGASQPAH